MRDRNCFCESEVYEELDNVNKLMERVLIFRSSPRVQCEKVSTSQMAEVNLKNIAGLRTLPLEWY